jgi:hypothetical protein
MEKLSKALENAPKQTVELQKMLQGSFPGLGAIGQLPGFPGGPKSGLELTQKYLESIRPAAVKQIDLPERALRRPQPVRKAASVSGASPVKPLAPKATTARKATTTFSPSVVSSPAKAQTTGASRSVTVATLRSAPNLAPKVAPKAQDRVVRPVRRPNPSIKGSGLTEDKRKSVTIDPKVLAKMKSTASKTSEPKKIAVDPKILGKLKSQTTKPGT